MIKMMGIKRNFIRFMIIAIILPIVIGSVSSTIISRQMMRDEIASFNKSWIINHKDYMDLLLQSMDNLIDHVIDMDKLIAAPGNVEGLVSIDLLSVNGTHEHVGEALEDLSTNSQTRDKLYALALKTPGSIAWAGLTDNINANSAHRQVISAVRLMEKTDPVTQISIPTGFIILNYDVEHFYDLFSQGYFNKNSTLMIVGPESKILFHPDKTRIGTSVNDGFMAKIKGTEGSFTGEYDGQDMFVVYSNSERYGWTVLSYIPENKLTASSMPIIWNAICVALLCLLLSSNYALAISEKMLDPINEITLTFQEIGNDRADLSKRLEVRTQDEIGELVRWFNTFMQNLSDKKIIEEQLKQANEVLESRVRQRTLEIQETLERLKATQNQLIQREKLAGIGQLAAGIAHEINNPLGYVTSNMVSLEYYFSNLKDTIEAYRRIIRHLENSDDEALRALCNEAADFEMKYDIDYITGDLDALFLDMNGGLERVGQIVSSLRMFSWAEHNTEFEPTYDLNKGIEDCLMIAQNEVKYVAEVEKELGSIPHIEAISGVVNQVILNVVVNAAQAIKMKGMESPGLITIRTWNDDYYVYCSIKDNGIGIPLDQLKHIFNPFYTTKPVGEGSGLGLSISYDIIVNQHNGYIMAESEEGEWTQFKIVLPIRQRKKADVFG